MEHTLCQNPDDWVAVVANHPLEHVLHGRGSIARHDHLSGSSPPSAPFAVLRACASVCREECRQQFGDWYCMSTNSFDIKCAVDTCPVPWLPSVFPISVEPVRPECQPPTVVGIQCHSHLSTALSYIRSELSSKEASLHDLHAYGSVGL